MSLLPSRPDFVSDAGPRVVGVDSDEADALMSALSSETARRLLAELHEEPAPPAELADRADTTLQNTQYHLSNLEEAGAVEVIGTAYSEKGREMDVYAPADQPLVIFAGQEQQAAGLKAALSRLLGGVGALLVGSLAVQEAFGDGLGSLVGFGGMSSAGGADSGGAGGGGGTATDTAVGTTFASDAGGDAAATPSATATPPPDGGTATATSGGPGVFTTGEPSATDAATETVTRATEAATSTPTAEATPTAAPTPAPTAAPTATPTHAPTETLAAAGDGGLGLVATLPPGALFFLGGLTVLLVGVLLSTRM